MARQYSPNPSPMVPEPVSLQGSPPSPHPPPFPTHHSSQASPPAPSAWPQPQNHTMNVFPHGYPGPAAFSQYNMPMLLPGSYYNPPVVLPQNVPPTPDAVAGANGYSNDWVGPMGGGGWPRGMQQTPFNGPQPHTGFSTFQQPLPGGGGPVPGPSPWGAYNNMGTPAAWYQGSSGPWTQNSGWGGPLPSIGTHTPWAGGGAWPQQPPPVIPQPPAAPALRDRSNEGLDRANKFSVGPGYGPVLTPLLLRIVNAKLIINPLLSPPDTSLENPYLKWNMLFGASHCVRSDDPPQRSWSRGRAEPATYPRLTELKIVSRTFPWTVVVIAADEKMGVTCGEVIDRLDDFLHKNLKKVDADIDTLAHKAERDTAYWHNRSTALGVPGGRLGEGLRRLDWLCKDTMFGGMVVDEGHVMEAYSAAVSGVLTLLCTTRYPLTEEEMKEQEAREKKEEEALKALEERARLAEQRAFDAEARERARLAKRARSRSRSSRATSVRDDDDDDDDDDAD